MKRVSTAESPHVADRSLQNDEGNVIARDVFSVLVDNRRIEDNAGRELISTRGGQARTMMRATFLDAPLVICGRLRQRARHSITLREFSPALFSHEPLDSRLALGLRAAADRLH